MYVHVRTCTCTCMYMYIHVHVHICTYTCIVYLVDGSSLAQHGSKRVKVANGSLVKSRREVMKVGTYLTKMQYNIMCEWVWHAFSKLLDTLNRSIASG